MKNKRLAAVDMGTNTLRLIIADVQSQDNAFYSINELSSKRIITRLGEGISDTGLLSRASVERSLDALADFKKTISGYSLDGISYVATSAIRDAKNSSEFLKKAEAITGTNIDVLSGEREAMIAATGMITDLIIPDTAFLADIGGGSTEIVYMKDRIPLTMKSLNLGVVYLASKYMISDPPTNSDLEQMGHEITHNTSALTDLFSKYRSGDTILIGTAGTVTTLAAISNGLVKFEHDKVHKTLLNYGKIQEIYDEISKMPSDERAKYIPFEPSRLDIIVPGTLIILILMKNLGFNKILVSNFGLREGVLIELYKSLSDH